MKSLSDLTNNNHIKSIYYLTIIISGILSLITLLLGFVHGINIAKPPFSYIDTFTLMIFTIDYFSRLVMAKDKWHFITHNLTDLLAIIPFNILFASFRIFRVFRIFKLLKISRIFMFVRFIGVAGKFRKNILKFLKINGLIYLIVISLLALVIAAILYSLAENTSLSDSIWWAIVTATTVGYGDISPHTVTGRIASIILMLIGIGFIGTLTSSISSFFIQNGTNKDEHGDEILNKLNSLSEENKNLRISIDKLEKKIDDLNHKSEE